MNIRSQLVLLFALCAPVVGQSIQLRDGSVLVGEVQNPTGEGFTLLRSDNGGVLELRWTHLTASSARSLREKAGLLNTKDDEVTVRADVVRYETSTGKVNEAVGIIVKKDADFIHLRRGRDITPIRRSSLRGLSQRQVPPHDIYTVEDYYTDLLQKAAPGEDADKHLALGEELMRVRDYEHAELHLKKAKDLGGGRQQKVLDQRLARLALLKNSAEERQLLDEIRTFTNRGRFAAAARQIAKFKDKFANSKLADELDRLERNFTKARRSHLGREVARLWYSYVTRLAATKARDPKTTLAMARSYGEREMGKDIRAALAQSLSIEQSEVEDLWQSRFDLRVASGQHYYYSIGSWLLGPAAVLKDTAQGAAEAKAKAEDDKSAEQKKVDEGLRRIREALKRSRQARQRRAGGAGQGKKQVTPEDWWKQADRNQRITWLKAYYAEFSGDMKVTAAHLSPCSNCGGTGTRIIQGATGQAQSKDCPVCRRTRYKRDIRAR